MTRVKTKRDFATPHDYERGDEIALKCRTTGRVHKGLFQDFSGGILFVHHKSANTIRSRSLHEYAIIPPLAA